MEPTLEARAITIRDHLRALSLPNGAVIEGGQDPYQASCHMHLLEACLAWESSGGGEGWAGFSDQIMALARSTFIDTKEGFVRELFGSDWKPLLGKVGHLVEPGHQFEWAWLMARYGLARSDAMVLETARKLYAHGMSGVSELMGTVVDAMNEDGSIHSRRARLWPQTEWLKSALVLAQASHGADRRAYLENAAAAQRALWLYLTVDGLWRDTRLPSREFIDEPASASSFYHVMAAFKQMQETATACEVRGLLPLDLK